MLFRGLLVGFFVLTLVVGVNAGVRIPLSAAMAECDKRSKEYATSLVGRGGEMPSDDLVMQHYRSCVHAKSGIFPPKGKVRNGIRISGSVTIGIVIGN